MRKRVYRWLLRAGLGVVIVFALFRAFAPRPPLLPKDSIESVAIALEETPNRQQPANISSTDKGKIEALAAVLRRAEPAEDHKCGDGGIITFRFKDGSETRLGILAGHDPRYYEYRAYTKRGYSIFRVERDAFMLAMGKLGIARLDRNE